MAMPPLPGLGCGGLVNEEGFDLATHRIGVATEKVDKDHRQNERAAGPDQRRVVRPREIIEEAAEKPPEARAETEDHEAVAIDLAKGPLSHIARHQKGDQVDLGSESQAQQNYPDRR